MRVQLSNRYAFADAGCGLFRQFQLEFESRLLLLEGGRWTGLVGAGSICNLNRFGRLFDVDHVVDDGFDRLGEFVCVFIKRI